MNDQIYFGILVVLFIIVVNLITRFLFELLLRGFVPFLPSRPWVVNQILNELVIRRERPVCIALSCGRSGFFYALKKRQPEAVLIGIQPKLFQYVVAKIQIWIRRRDIKIIHEPIRRANVKDADFIYCHLYPDAMEGLGEKLKFECRTGTQIVSTGFNIPHLEPTKVIDLFDEEGRYNFLLKNRSISQPSRKKWRKEKRAYFYEI
jgi:hypothetical protein